MIFISKRAFDEAVEAKVREACDRQAAEFWKQRDDDDYRRRVGHDISRCEDRLYALEVKTGIRKEDTPCCNRADVAAPRY